jgi:hypothetical protein
MPLDEVLDHGLDYAICTDVGASPTTSELAEMAQFLKVQAQCNRATPAEALFRSTLAPARMLGLQGQLGSFDVGKPMSYVEVDCAKVPATANEAIQIGLLDLSEAELADYRSGHRSEAVTRLRASGLDCGADLDLLESDTRQCARRLEGKVLGVTLAGRNVFQIHASEATESV